MYFFSLPMLNERQKQVLDFMKKYQAKKGIFPSLKEIGAHLGLSSVSTVHHHVKILEEQGFLRRAENRPRGVEIFDAEAMVSVPIKGTITAGEPIYIFEETNESIAIAQSKLPKTSDIYALRVSGESMIEENIDDGDIVIIRQQSTVDDGEKAVALIGGQEATLKKIYREKDTVRLQPANPKFEPRYVDPDDLLIQGKVVTVVKTL